MVDSGSKSNMVMPTFLNMPLNVANLILEKMKPIDLLRARKVCRSLRTVVDEFRLRFGYINLSLMKNEVEMKLSGTYVRYTKAANDSSNVIHNGQAKLIGGENFVERAFKDLMILSKHARKIAIWNYSEDRREIVTTFIEILKSEKCIQVEEIKIWHFSFDEVLTILTCFNSKLLRIIELGWMKSIDQFERIVHLEQWKNADEVVFWGSEIASTVIVHFLHFKFFHIYQMDEFPEQAAIQIRDDLLKKSTFQSCKISFENSKSNPTEIAKVFKPDYNGYNEFEMEFSNSNDKFVISLKDHEWLKAHFVLNVKKL